MQNYMLYCNATNVSIYAYYNVTIYTFHSAYYITLTIYTYYNITTMALFYALPIAAVGV